MPTSPLWRNHLLPRHLTGQKSDFDHDSMPNGFPPFLINKPLKSKPFLSLLPSLISYFLSKLSERALSRLEGLDSGLKWFAVTFVIFLLSPGKSQSDNTMSTMAIHHIPLDFLINKKLLH